MSGKAPSLGTSNAGTVQPRRRRLGRYAYKLWLPVVSIVAFIGTAELLCRVLNLSERMHADFKFYVTRIDNDLEKKFIVEDALLMWSLRPNYPPGINSINADGFHDRTYSKEKGENVFRIACLGDSSTFGMGVDQNYTYHEQLERVLENAASFTGVKTEIINAGVPGYTTAQCLAMYQYRVREYHPDVVTLYAGVNDPIHSYHLCDEDLLRTDVPVWLRRFANEVLLHLQSYRVLRRLILGSPEPSGASGPPNVPRVNLEQFRANIERLHAACEEDGVALVVISPPARKERPLHPDRARDMVEYRRVLEETCTHAGIPLVRIPEMTERSPEPTEQYFTDWVHPNARGHRLIANHLWQCLYEHHLLPASLEAATTQNSV